MKKPNSKITPQQIQKIAQGNNRHILREQKIRDKIISNKSRIEKASRPKQFLDNAMLLNTIHFRHDVITEYPVPEWFRKESKVEISIIVPLYKTGIDNLMKSWDVNYKGIPVEFLFIDDNCPQNSKGEIVKHWENNKKPVGRIFQSSLTQGWNACCNIGANQAHGKTLIFVDPRLLLTPDWITQLILSMRIPNLGIMGVMYVDSQRDMIIEAGKEWNWEQNRFLNTGSAIYKGTFISNPFQLNNTPYELLATPECEAIRSNLIMVKKEDFDKVGGFSSGIYSQEWNDVDFCMKIKELNKKNICESRVRAYIENKPTDSKEYQSGMVHFTNKFCASGRLDSLVTAQREKRPTIRRITVKRNAAHGDVLIASAVASALKKKYPESKIHFTTSFPEVLLNHPHIEHVREIDYERTFDLYFNLDMIYEFMPNKNILQAYADEVGVKLQDCEIHLHTEHFEGLPEEYIVLHAGKTSWAGRNWSSIKFDQLSKRLKQDGHYLVAVGSAQDQKPTLCDLDLRNQTNIHQLAHVIKHAKCFVGIDSFPMHIAQAFSTPSVVFFGSIKPETRIYNQCVLPVSATNIKCLGCHHENPTPCVTTSFCKEGVQECINGVTVDNMYYAIQEILNKKQS